MQEPIRAHIGRFEVVRKLGAGAMGSVYEAHDPKLDRRIAIKVLHRDEPFRERPDAGESLAMSVHASGGTIQDEGRALARLNHPNVVAVYDVGEIDGQLFIAMEHMAGGSLRELFDREPPRSWWEIVEKFLHAGRGLSAAHAAGVIHRDFKTDNVLVDARGVAKVADFGVARVHVELNPDAPPPTTVVGTRAYMAPEVLRGEGATPSSDQFSYCAAVLGELEFYGEGVSSALCDALRRGMAADPAERWATLDELLRVLQGFAPARADRHRERLIERVHRIWIEGVLRPSLEERPLVSLPMHSAPELVDAPWDRDLLSSNPDHRSEGLRTGDLLAAFERSEGALLIVGAPGAGKTTASLQTASALLDRARTDPAAPVPVLINLSAYDGRGTLANLVESELVAKYRLPRMVVRGWLEADDLVLVLDGLDELSSERRVPCIHAINEFRASRPVPLIVSCRDAEYRASGQKLSFGCAVCLDPIDFEAAEAWGVDFDLGVVDDDRLRTPLWLAMAGGRESGGATSWEGVLDGYVASALDRAPRLEGRERERFLERLSWLAANMSRRSESEFWLDRLQYDWLPGVGRQILALVLGTLVTVLLLVLPSVLASMAVGRSALSGFVLGFGGLGVGLVFNRGLRTHTGEKLRWSGRSVVRRILPVVLLGSTFGVNYSLVMDKPMGAMVYLGTMGALVVAALLGLDYSNSSRGLKPYDGIRVSLRQWITVTLGFGVATGLAFALIISPIYGHFWPEMLLAYPGINVQLMHGVTLGTVVGFALGYVYGGATILLHACWRFILAATTPMPLRLLPLLDDATSRGLMRRVGGGYMFMHATLLEHLARGADGRTPRR